MLMPCNKLALVTCCCVHQPGAAHLTRHPLALLPLLPLSLLLL